MVCRCIHLPSNGASGEVGDCCAERWLERFYLDDFAKTKERSGIREGAGGLFAAAVRQGFFLLDQTRVSRTSVLPGIGERRHTATRERGDRARARAVRTGAKVTWSDAPAVKPRHSKVRQ